jgi:4-amino-4-deoxy-L-arabinose transferase-like glycosyltransferase
VLRVNASGIRGAKLRDWLAAQKSRNTLLVLAVVVLAAVIRFWNFGSLGYEHYDEYYFVSSADAISQSWPRGLDLIYWGAAPLVSYTDGMLFHLFGVNNWMPLAVSATYGTLSAVALYFLGSRIYGSAVGLIAAAILATAEFSVMYSRMALSDATFNFWLIVSVLLIWLGFTRGRFVYWVLAGVSSGILLNTIYDGAFPLILAVTLLSAEFVVDLVVGRRAFVSRARSEYLPRVIGVAAMVAIALMLFAPWLNKLAHNPGFAVFFGVQGNFFIVKTPATFIVWYYWLFTSPATVVLAVVGLLVGVLRFTQADRFMLIYTLGWVAAILLFGAYPREALTLLPAIAIWAGRAIVEIWTLIRSSRPSLRVPAAAIAAACVAAVLLGQLIPLPHFLSLNTKGYAEATAITDKFQATGAALLIHTQPVAFLYLHNYPFHVARKSSLRALTTDTSNLYFMTDHTLTSDSDVMAFFELNRDRLQVVDRVPNELYPDTVLLPATADKLAHLDDPPDAFRYITIWKATAPLLYPPGWPQ